MFFELWLNQKSMQTKGVDLSREIELDSNPKAIQRTEVFRQLKNIDGLNVDGHNPCFF